MKKSRFTEKQIMGALREHEAGEKTTEICRRLGVTVHAFYHWKSKYGNLIASLL